MINNLAKGDLISSFEPNIEEFEQHLLIDKNVINILVNSLNIKPIHSVLELGGGSGNITKRILQNTNNITIVEKDENIAELLIDNLKEYNIKLIGYAIS